MVYEMMWYIVDPTTFKGSIGLWYRGGVCRYEFWNFEEYQATVRYVTWLIRTGGYSG